MVVKEVKKAVGTATDKFSASSAQAQELARSLMQGQGKEQVSKAAQEILKWSNRNRERVTELVRSEVASQLKSLGVASRDEVDALRKRVRELERAQTKRPAAKRSTSSSTAAKSAKPAAEQA
jgi:polyhydroxyalkanoate synthesis regulator phasin